MSNLKRLDAHITTTTMNSPWCHYLLLVLIGPIHFTTSLYNAKPAKIMNYNYVVGLTCVKGTTCRPFCTGSTITPKHILTAGHCVICPKEEDIQVAAGIEDWNMNIIGEFRNVAKINRHPEFDPGMRFKSLLKKCCVVTCECIFGPPHLKLLSRNDIAVLTLTEILVDPFRVQPRIGSVDVAGYFVPPPYGSLCQFAGWGRSEVKEVPRVLRWTEYKILTSVECRERGMQVREDEEICAVDPGGKAYPGGGDSGGALICNGIAVGILHSASNDAYYPTSFTFIPNYRDFIDGVTVD